MYIDIKLLLLDSQFLLYLFSATTFLLVYYFHVKYKNLNGIKAIIKSILLGLFTSMALVALFLSLLYTKSLIMFDSIVSDISSELVEEAKLRQNHFYKLGVYEYPKMVSLREENLIVNELEKSYSKPIKIYRIPKFGASSLSDGKNEYASQKSDGKKQKIESQINASNVALKYVKFLPQNIFVDDGSYGGSAGLMLALELIHQFGEDDLIGDLIISGTGTIDKEGNVGAISGLELKLLAAEEINTNYCFVPKSQYKEALDVVNEHDLKLVVVPVGNVDEAVFFLKNVRNH